MTGPRQPARRSHARRLLVSLLAAVLALGPAGVMPVLAPVAAHGATSNASQVAKALDYLHARQVSGGGFAEKGSSASDALTSWAIVAIASAGEDPNAWRVSGRSPVDYLATQSANWRQTTDVARTVLAAVAARKDPTDFGGVDLVAKLRSETVQRGDTEQIGPYVNSHIWAMIALDAAGEGPSGEQAAWLLDQQNSDGGWGWASGISSDSNDTAAALQALAAAGEGSGSSGVKRAISYLRTMQAKDGGFAYASGYSSDANSTAWVVQGLVAAGQSPDSWKAGGHTPLSYLRSLQTSQGYVNSAAGESNNPLMTTVQTVPAFRKRAFPIAKAPSGTVGTWRPVVTVTHPAAGATVVLKSGSALKFTVSDGSGTGVTQSAVTARVDGTKRTVRVSDGVWRVALSGLDSGTHTVSISVTDRAGNKGATTSRSFTVSTSSGSESGTSATSAATSATASAAATGSASATGSATASATAQGAAAYANDTEASAGSSDASRTYSGAKRSGSGDWWLYVLGVLALAAPLALLLPRRRRR